MLSALLGISTNVGQLLFAILTRRRDRLSLRSILAMFLLGVAVVIPVAALQNALLGGSGNLAFGSALIVGITEELAKGAVFIPFILRARRRSATGIDVADGIACAIAVAAGSAFIENLFAIAGGGNPLMRVVAGFGHMTDCVISATGVVSGMAAAERGDKARAAACVLGGFAVAILLHAVWDSAFAVFYGLVFALPGAIMLMPIASYLMYAYWIAVSVFGICFTAHHYRKRSAANR